MSRIGPCQDPKRWHGAVIDWVDRRVAKLNAERLRNPNPQRQIPEFVKSPAPRKRFLLYLDAHIRYARNGKVESAQALVSYFYCTSKAGDVLDPRVMRFLSGAFRRYRNDPDHRIDKALYLVRPKEGNPGGVSKKRRMTPDGKKEAALEALNLIGSGEKDLVAVLTVAKRWECSERTIRAAIKAAREDRAVEKLVRSIRWPRKSKYPE